MLLRVSLYNVHSSCVAAIVGGGGLFLLGMCAIFNPSANDPDVTKRSPTDAWVAFWETRCDKPRYDSFFVWST